MIASAMAEGALEGTASLYEVVGPYDTDFYFSRFSAAQLPALVAAGYDPWWASVGPEDRSSFEAVSAAVVEWLRSHAARDGERDEHLREARGARAVPARSAARRRISPANPDGG